MRLEPVQSEAPPMPGHAAAQARLSVLQLAAELGNVSEACRRHGMDRASFYEWRRRFQAHGFDGLKGLHPPICAEAQQITETLRLRIRALALEHASNTSARIASILSLDDIRIAACAIQEVLAAIGLGTDRERWLHLEALAQASEMPLSPDQLGFIEKFNPCFRERGCASPAPGALLVQDTLFSGTTRGGQRLYLHAVLDSFASYAWGLLHPARDAAAAAALLHNDVLPFFRRAGREVGAIATDGGHEFTGDDSHPYRLYLALNGVEHRCPKARVAHANGFMARFAAIFREEFEHPAPRFRDAGQAESRLAAWLDRYNTRRPHEGYPNYGSTPQAMLRESLDADMNAVREAGRCWSAST